MKMKIIQCGIEQLELAAPLFNAYRKFYGQPSDLESAGRFLQERVRKNESVIFLAMREKKATGFVQLYPSFSSVSLLRLWILNDLFVAEEARKQGVASALMERATLLARETASKGIILETGIENQTAQSLYEKLGYLKSNETFHYFLPT
jgi:GNAT superfamily N-acetyltransferase